MNQESSPPAKADEFDLAAIHFLHIGKTAGTAIARVLAQADRPVFEVHRHRVNLSDLPRRARYFFSIRDPVARFYSGFYSRKRRGQPTFNRPWSRDETLAFRIFPEANDLAEALFEPGAVGLQATQAILSIQHTARKQVSWFDQRGNLFTVQPPVWIIRQEQFAADLARFAERVGLQLKAPRETVERVHANDYGTVPPLSDKARANLERWYADDVAFYGLCEAWLATNR